LGYKNSIAQDALDKVMIELTTDLAMEQILKRTLKILSD